MRQQLGDELHRKLAQQHDVAPPPRRGENRGVDLGADSRWQMLRLLVCLCALCVATQLVRVEGVGAESWRAHHGEDTAPAGPAVSALDTSPSQDEDLGEGKSGPFAQEARVGVAALDADWVAMKNQTIWTRHGPSVTKKTFKAYYLKKYNSLNNNDETAIAVRHCLH